jgi:hypothetical protein
MQLLSIFIADSTQTLFNLFIPFHKPAPSESGIILNGGGGGAAQLFIPISRGGDGAKNTVNIKSTSERRGCVHFKGGSAFMYTLA